jgi:hypothetical protein
VTDLQPAGEAEGSAASLAAAVSTRSARQEAQPGQGAGDLPDDLLPGVNPNP